MLDHADIKASVWNALMVFLLVLVTVPLAKYVTAKYPVPGLSDLVQSI